MAKRNTYSGFHRAFDEGYTSWYNTKKYQADDERRRRDEIARQMEEEEEARREAARLLEEEGRAERGIGGNLVMRNRTNPLSGENRLIGTREASIGRMRNAATEYRPTGLSITQEPSYYSSRGLNPMNRVPERVQEYNSRSEDQAEYNRKYRDIVNRARSQYGDDDYAYAAQILINDRKQDDLEAEANRIRQGGGIIGNVSVANPSERLRQIEEERNRLSQRNQQLHDEYTNQQVRSTMTRETMGQLSDLSRQGLNPARNFDTGRVTQAAAERIAPLEQFYEYRDSNLVGNSLMAGLNAFNAGAMRTLDKAEDFLGGNASRQTVQGVAKLFGKDIDVSDPTRDVADYYQGLQQEYATKASYAKARSIVNEAIGMFAENLGQNLPLMALGPLGGAGAAATNTLATGTGALATQAAQQLISNPSFLLSSMSSMGNTYNDSIASGKTELEAISDALVNGTLSAMIEVGGGIGATEAADAARGLWRNVISTAGEEAMEELWQGLVESAVTSDADTPLFSVKYGEDAIINPVNLGANMLAGAAMGGAFGGMNAVPGAISDAIARGRMDFDAIASDPEVRKYILDPANQPEIERIMGKDDAQRMVTAAAEANSRPAPEARLETEVSQTPADTSGNLHTSADNRQQEQTAVRTETDAKPEPYVASGRRATYAPSGEDVDLASTFTVRDGEIYFPTEDGGSMAMGDIEFPDAQTDSLYNSAANYDTAEARAFVSNYTGGDVNSYARGFRAISEAAHVGNALDATVQRSIYAQSIPAPQRQAIYDAALNATEAAPVTAPAAPVAMPAVETAQTSTEAAEAAQPMQEAVPAVTIKGGGVIRETTGKLSHQQRVQVRGMDMLAKKYGVTIRLVDSIDVTMADGTVRRSAANGMYSGGVITVAKDSVGDGYMYVATHEMTHMVRDMGGDSYTLLEDTVLEALRNAGEDVDALIRHQMDIHDAAGMTEEEFRAYCTEEVVANSIPAILTDKETVRRLVAEDRSLVQKMADFFRDLADTMTEIFEKIKGEASWKQMDALSRNRDTLREIADVFMGALEVAGENQTTTTQETRQSIVERDGKQYVVADREVIHGNDPKAWGRQITDYINNEIRHGRDVVVHAANGTPLTITKDTAGKAAFRNTVRTRDGRERLMTDKEYATKLRAESHIDELAQVSKGVGRTRPDTKGHAFARDGFNYRTAYFQDKTGYYEITMSVGKTGRINTIYNVGKIEKAGFPTKWAQRPGRSKTETGSSASSTSIPTPNKSVNGKFSLKDTTPADTERMAALEAENASLREALDIAKSQLKLTQGHHVSDKAVASVARKLLKETQSSYDAETFAENLQQMFDYIANTDADQVAWEDIRDMGVGMAREVLEKSEALDDGVEAYVADARNYLRTTAISLSDAQKAEAAYAMCSTYNDFRRHLFGSVRLSNSGISLEDAWSELSSMMPDLFPPDTDETDMPALLLEAVDAMKPQYINPYGYDMDGAAYDLFLRMYDAYFDLPEVRTYADKQAAKYAQLKAQYTRKIAEARTSARERYDARLKALRKQHTEMRQEISRKYAEARNKADAAHKADMDRLRAQYRALSDRKNEQLLEQKAKFAEWKRSDRERRQESEAVRKYRTRIEKNVKDMADWLTRPTDSHHVPEELRRYVSEWLSGFDFSRSIDRDTKKAQAWRDRLMSVRWALARAESDEDAGGFLMELDPDFLPRLDNFLAKPGTSWYIMRMDSQELAELDYMVSVLKHAITDANKLHANAIYQRIADAAEATKSDLMPMKAWKSRGPRDMFRNFFNLSQSDVFTYFDRLGPAAQSILAELRGGLDKKVDRTYQAQQFANEAIRGLDMRRITGKDARLLTFKVAGGEIQMTKGQVMELYILNQREQARGHIYGKGIRVVDTKARDAKGRRVYTRSTDPVVVTEADVDTIIASLTQQEREVADSLRDYMSTTVSGWGNEASMAMYGYKKFTEPAYWPIRSDENFTKTQDPEAATSGMYALRNLGMTKQTVKNASNAIMLGDAFDTFCRHIDEMTSYNAFVVPLSDAMRWFNYKGDSRSVKQDIDRVVGPEGKRYFINFVKDLNGATEGASRGLGDVLTRNAKIAAVGSNVRVVIQQPTAYLRAAAVMDSKYLMAGITGAFSAKAHELAMKYAPIVRWKSWGYYDTNMGQSMRDLLIPDRETVTSYLQDKSTWLAGVADTVTWNALWRACESEIKSTRKDLKPGTDDFYKAVGARLSEVIDRTQVVDSVFHKSQLMRSKNGMDKMITNFMAEPTKSYNMLMSAIIKAGQSKQKWKAGKILGRAAMAYAVTAAVNAAMQSFVDAIRDKEKKDKDGNVRSYWDKWLDAFWGDYSSIELEELDGTRETLFRNAMTIEEGMAEALMNSNLGGNLNPLNLIPYVKDILSIMQGYDAPRLDMKGITEVVSVINGLQKWMAGESKWSFAKVMVDTAGGLSYITGIPVSNIIRDVTGVYDLVAKEPIDWESETSTHARSAETLYNALMAGDKDKYNTLLPKLEADREKGIREGEAERIASGKDPAYANDAAIISEAKHRVQNDIASLLMSNPDIALAYQYREEGRTGDLSKVYTKLKELGFPADTITMAINKYANTIRESDPKGVRESPATYDYQSLFGALDRGSMTDFEIIKKDIIANSDALDPDDAVKSQLTKKYKPLYTGYYDSGDAASMRKLGERLVKTGYFSQGSLDDWCMGHERDGLWKAIEDGDVYEANERINAMRGLGRDDDGLKSSITSKWKPIYRTASASERSSIMDMLARLDVYDSDGNRFYTRERVSKWLDE